MLDDVPGDMSLNTMHADAWGSPSIIWAGDAPGGGPTPSASEVGEEKARQDPPSVILLGPTGSGKTSVSIELAKALNGEIVSADSRAIYKGMDIGTAKPSLSERQGVPHFGFDLVEPGERFTVADWKAYAESKIAEIRSRGHLPMVVGGTGLYIDALVYDYQFRGPTGERIGDFEQKTCSDRTEIKGNYLIIGVKTEPDILRARLRERLNKMFTQGLYEETKKLVQSYGWGSGAMKSNIYEYAWKYLEGELTLDEAKEKCFYEDWHLAKRQITWFKRNKDIVWLELEKIYPYVTKFFEQASQK